MTKAILRVASGAKSMVACQVLAQAEGMGLRLSTSTEASPHDFVSHFVSANMPV